MSLSGDTSGDHMMDTEEIIDDSDDEGLRVVANDRLKHQAVSVETITIDDDDDDEDDNGSDSDDVVIIDDDSDSGEDSGDEEVDDINHTINISSDQMTIDSSVANDSVSLRENCDNTTAGQSASLLNTDVKSDDNNDVKNGDLTSDLVSNGTKAAKRANLTSLPSTSNSTIDPNVRPIKMQRMAKSTSGMAFNLVTKKDNKHNNLSIADSETIFESYLQAFRERMSALNAANDDIQASVDSLNVIFIKLKENAKQFLASKQYSKLLYMFTEEILVMESKDRIISHNNDLTIELKRLTEPAKSDCEMSGRAKAKAIDKMTDQLKKIQKQIFKAEHEELDMDDLNSKSTFTDLPKLYRRAQELWEKREKFLKRSTNSGRNVFKKLKYDSTPYPTVNRCVENVFNTFLKRLKVTKNKSRFSDESFTFIDVRKAILDVIQSEGLVVANCDQMIENIYKDLLTENRNRRTKDREELFETYETYDDLRPDVFVADHPLIDKQCAENNLIKERKLKELFAKYASEDIRKNGPTLATDGNAPEWDGNLVDNDEGELLDVKDGELDGDSESSEDQSDVEEGVDTVADKPSVEITANSSQESAPIALADDKPVNNEVTGSQEL